MPKMIECRVHLLFYECFNIVDLYVSDCGMEDCFGREIS